MALRDVAVVGVHATEQARQLPHRTSLDLAQESVLGAIADAGLGPTDVDGVAADWPGPGGRPGEAASWARVLGRPLSWVSDGLLDAAGARGVMKAAAAISAGLCDVAVVGGGLAGRFGRGQTVNGAEDFIEFTDVWGAYVVRSSRWWRRDTCIASAPPPSSSRPSRRRSATTARRTPKR